MKYLFAFIFGAIWTIVYLVIGVITHIVYIIWTFKIEIFYPFNEHIEHYKWWTEEDRFFPVFGHHYKDTYRVYKSYFHYIWGFKSKQL